MREKKVVQAVVLIATVICSMVATGLLVRNMKNQYLEKQYQILAEDVYELTDNKLSGPIVASITMSDDYFMKEFLKEEDSFSEDEAVTKASKYLSDIKDSMNAQTAYLISEHSKRYYSYDGLNKVIDPQNDSHDSWYSIFINSRKKYDLDVDVDQVNNNEWTVFVNARIEDENGKLLGVCGIGCSMDGLQEMLLNVEQTYGVKVNFVNSDGLVQVDTDTVNIEVSYLYDVQYGKEKDGYTYKNEDGDFVIMRYVENLNWYMVLHGKDVSLGKEKILLIILNGVCVILVNLVVLLMVKTSKKIPCSSSNDVHSKWQKT